MACLIRASGEGGGVDRSPGEEEEEDKAADSALLGLFSSIIPFIPQSQEQEDAYLIKVFFINRTPQNEVLLSEKFSLF